MYLFGSDERPENENFPNQHVFYLTNTDLQYLRDDVYNTSLEYYVSPEYQKWADEFLKTADTILAKGL